MDKRKAQELLNKYLDGTCTSEEKSLVEKWYNKQIDENETSSSPVNLEHVGNKIFKRLQVGKARSWNPYYRFSAAAIILITIGLGVYFQSAKNTVNIEDRQMIVNDIAPGGDKAFLTLSDGKQISLTDVENGDIFNKEGITITKTADGQLVYSLKENASTTFAYNTISTPKGGQFKVQLPDGSNIWLNSESSLTYPTSFSSLKKRQVELKGEAYFEVAHNIEKPFIVNTVSMGRVQEVEVLGTHFNINSYENEHIIKTTLLEGSVRVKALGSQIVLGPNQQANLKGEKLSVKAVNPEQAIAWKNGYFMFEDEGIESIMRKIARWYNLDVIYKGSIPRETFTGEISRKVSLPIVLNFLKNAGIHYQISGNTLTITN